MIPETLKEMETDTELQTNMAKLQSMGQAALTREERVKRQRSLDSLNLPSFGRVLKVSDLSLLWRTSVGYSNQLPKSYTTCRRSSISKG